MSKDMGTAGALVRKKALLTITWKHCGNVRTVGGFDT